MTAQALSAYKFAASYGRYLPGEKRRETPREAFSRVVQMHREKYAGWYLEEELKFVQGAMNDGLVLGSQRALQFGGQPILRREARIYNCTTSYCDRPRFFQECLWLLLCGCGTGFSVQRHHVAKLPKLVAPTSHQKKTYVIQDSIEGWADALGVLLSSYGIIGDGMDEFSIETSPGTDEDFVYQPEGRFSDYVGHNVVFDFSRIRDRGAPLSTGAGKAPGPAPLKAALDKVREVLDARVNSVDGTVHLRPIDCYDIVMHASDAVLSGGVRRSATICLFSPDDEEMLNAKVGNWISDNPQRARSNNSAVLLRDEVSWEQFYDIFMTAREQYGEPGFVWADDTEITYNPCVEIGLYPAITVKEFAELEGLDVNDMEQDALDLKLSGWAFCNLSEINAKACQTEEDWERACRAAAILGTLQAGYTNFTYLGNVSSAIAKREALLGCSMTGMMDNPDLAFDPEKQRSRAALILAENERMAKKLSIRPTARATCVKPAGSTSCIFGTSSGIHAQHAKRYFRRSQANALEAPAQYFKLVNPSAVEKSVWNPNGTDLVLTFCIEADEEALTRHEVNGLKQLEYVKLTQENWVEAGRVEERCAAPWLRHNVSNTITIHQDQQEEACRYIYNNRHAFAGVSIVDASGDLDYPQAPFCEVRTEEDLLRDYGTAVMFASGLIVDGLHAFGDNLWQACDTARGLGEASVLENGVPYPDDPSKLPGNIRKAYEDVHNMKKDWVRRVKQFADRYFDGDVRKTTYCLKEVHNLKLWTDLTREYVEVDYSLMVEEKDGTKNVVADAACAGGECAVSFA